MTLQLPGNARMAVAIGADLRSSASRWRASSSIMCGCIVFTY